MSTTCFREIVVIDSEFGAQPGELPEPRCVVAKELYSGKDYLHWLDGVAPPATPPYASGDDVLVVGYYLAAEMLVYLRLGWEPPPWLVDLFAEHRVQTKGRPVPGNGLLDALAMRSGA
jgi:hypothetical protein